MTEPRIIGEFDAYPGLLAALRARVAELNVAGERLDELAGLPRGYFQKLLGSRPVKRIGMRSLGDIFGALALKAQLVEDPEAFARVAGRLKPRKQHQIRSGAVHLTLTRRFYRKIGLIGGRLSRSKMSRQRASELGRKAAMARWAKGG
jgi:hypothetical protein